LSHLSELPHHKIPDKIPSKNACPLLCAGATVWEPICNYVKPGYNVGISSIGGLGTYAVKLARIMGANVVAISSSADKEAVIKNIGANKFIVSSNKDDMMAAVRTLDVIIDTCPVNNNLSSMMDLLKVGSGASIMM
jgi:D-arabinose 1-dehydrogenase-like Zn-dependent alcohol dehydrogenase